ncbi:TolC family protein [Sulfuriferula nivalis]|uniref:Protein CyaE n=1 Tax=Sulfuriferula nivalis TaxID=2675298 RepID=A0A809S7T5_9PROT|nr:TolC family protein [Sulfuriferula nivalis]BBO99761.1 protein CyaE [Sulfuriferula nivalis]
MKFNRNLIYVLSCLAFAAQAADEGLKLQSSSMLSMDPFATHDKVAANVTGYIQHDCVLPAGAMNLLDVVNTALCNNPQTRSAWASAQVAAGQLGSAQSSYLPSVNGTANLSRDRSLLTGLNTTNRSFGLSLNYLLFDFGTRSAQRDAALASLDAANRNQDQAVNSVYLAVVQAYYQYFASQAQVTSLVEAEKSAKLSLDAATGRYQAGVNTRADVLQAQTAYSQAQLNRLRAEGDMRVAQGVLTNAVGLDADQSLNLTPPADDLALKNLTGNVRDLIVQAQQQRPDLQAAAAQLRAAQAQVRLNEAAGMPTLSLIGSTNYQDNGSINGTGNSIGLAVNVPIFTGFNSAYKIRTAQAQVLVQQAQQAQLSNQVALDVWRAWQNLATESNALKASADLVVSATASNDMALGRYRAGVGNILDVLNAQASLASARSQQIQAQYNLRIAKVALAQAVGRLDE